VLRLQRHSEFIKVLQKRRKVSSRDLVVHYFFREPIGNGDVKAGSAENRLGLAVSKAIGGAVVRNRVKRRFRVLAREFEYLLPSGTDIVMRALPSISAVRFSQIEHEVQTCFSRISQGAPTAERSRLQMESS
jgi:ribonuclease P protein component